MLTFFSGAAQIMVLEGLHPFYDERVRDLYDFKIYLDISDEVKFAWKIQRDMKERGHSLESIKASIEARRPDFDAYIDPQKKHADVIIQVRASLALHTATFLCTCFFHSNDRFRTSRCEGTPLPSKSLFLLETCPSTTCLQSSHGVGTLATMNCDGLSNVCMSSPSTNNEAMCSRFCWQRVPLGCHCDLSLSVDLHAVTLMLRVRAAAPLAPMELVVLGLNCDCWDVAGAADAVDTG